MPHLVDGWTIGTRPAELSACFASWSNVDDPQVLRSEMESGAVQVRRRFTAVRQRAQAECTYRPSLYNSLRDWYYTECLGGVYPTEVSPPWGGIEIWRFTAPLAFEWIGNKGVHVTFQLERDPRWP